ncbi:unnamed protein product, partial [Thlaspi arvense]
MRRVKKTNPPQNLLSTMAKLPPFFVTSLAGQNINPIIPDEFFSVYETETDLTLSIKPGKSNLTTRGSPAAGKISPPPTVFETTTFWFLDTRVIWSSTSHLPDACVGSSQDDDDDDDDDDGDDETWDDDSDSMNKKKSISKADSLTSTKNSCLLAVSPLNLRKNIVRCCEIDLMNQSGKSWVLGLRHNKTTGQVYMIRGWRSFCQANDLKHGPLLQLCSDIAPERNCSKPIVKANASVKSSSEGKNKFLTVTLKPYMFKSRQLYLPRFFARENGIKEEGEITLVDKNGVEWPSNLTSTREQSEFYVTKSWIRFCEANRLKIGETFTLKFVRGDTTPMLKFCSKAKVKMEQVPLDSSQGTVQASQEEEEAETRVQKSARVSAEGEPSHCTRASNKSSVDRKNSQCKQPLQPCSISDQLRKSIVDTLTGVRQFRSELEIKEQNLEASLQEMDALETTFSSSSYELNYVYSWSKQQDEEETLQKQKK